MCLGRMLQPVVIGAGVALALSSATALVWLLETAIGVSDASAAYLLAVVAIAVGLGTIPALATSIGAFAAYNFLFTDPRFTFVVEDSGQLLNLVLLLVVGAVVGQLAGAERSRARTAEAREREARLLFEISRSLSTRSVASALRDITATLQATAGVEAVWVGVGSSPGAERPMTDAPDATLARGASHHVLQRDAAAHPARWMVVRPPGAAPRDHSVRVDPYRVPLEVAGRAVGSLWALRARAEGPPDPIETRMLAGAADQVAQALEQERLRAEATSAELARRSEQAKSALLESVSHDLRTPLAAIRATAGALLDDGQGAPADVVEAAEAIDLEAARMARIVENLLETSRIEAGGVTVDLQPYALGELVPAALRSGLAGEVVGRPDVAIGDDLPYVLVDAVLLDQVIGNLVENAVRHGAPPIRITAGAEDGSVRLMIEDGGAGVRDAELARVFDKFYRAGDSAQRATRGVGLGLSVVRGLVEAMGGSIHLGRSELGGLAVEVRLRVATVPAEDGSA